MVKFLQIFLITGFIIGNKATAQTPAESNKSSAVRIDFDSVRAAVSNMRGTKLAKESIYGGLTPDSSDYYALIISTEKYTDKDWLTLKWPIRDGGRLKEVLVRRYKFDEGNVKMLSNPSRSELYAALQQYQRKLNRRHNLLIFYAGHGKLDQDEGYWIPQDGDHENPANWFSNDELKRIIRNINTQHTLVIADACFAGTLSRGDQQPDIDRSDPSVNWDSLLPDYMIRQRYGSRSRKVMTSGSLEQVPDQSTFIETLVWTLNHSTIKYLTAEQLFDQIKKTTTRQTPLFTFIPECGHQLGGDFIFTLR